MANSSERCRLVQRKSCSVLTNQTKSLCKRSTSEQRKKKKRNQRETTDVRASKNALHDSICFFGQQKQKQKNATQMYKRPTHISQQNKEYTFFSLFFYINTYLLSQNYSATTRK